MNNNRGRTLVESLVIVMIISILGGSLGFAYSGWMGRYNVEKQTNEIYSDLMTARMLAMIRNSGQYSQDFLQERFFASAMFLL